MSNFLELNRLMQEQFHVLTKTGNLFKTDVPGGYLWEIYMNSFDIHPLWRVNSVHNCDNDRHFFERYANIVAIVDNEIVTMFDFDISDCEYKNSIINVRERIKNSEIDSVYVESPIDLHKTNTGVYCLGKEKTFKIYRTEEEAKGKKIDYSYTFNHFHVFIPNNFINFKRESCESIIGELNTTRQLFGKTMGIPLDTLELVRDLIQQGSLLKGDMYLNKVLDVIKLKKEFNKISVNQQGNWLWNNFKSTPFARFANELIGTTCIELVEGKELNKVCKDFNIRVDPANYNKAKSPVTKSMIEEAEKTITDLGYGDSFERIFANIDDIDVSEIKHSNIDASKEKPVGLFGKAGVVTSSNNRHKRSEFDKVEEIHIDKFLSDILPVANSIEVFMENRFEGNLVSLFTAKNKTAKNLFKWDNTFSWTYNGNLSGKSMIKEAVKTAGGNIDGVLRASMIWNESGSDSSDLDVWCKQSTNQFIGYNTGFRKDSSNLFSNCGGQLDLDNTNPKGKLAVENIYFRSINEMKDGVYSFYVNQFSGRNSSKGFKFEIEFEGELFCYEYNKPVVGKIPVADITLKNGKFNIEHKLPCTTNSSKNLWNIETNQFHKVNLVCSSPNHWGDNNIGTKEYFFMIQDCKSQDPMRAFHIDQLNSELMGSRKAIDMLGNYKMVEPSDKQLSDIGFNCTVRDSLIVKVKGSHQRILKINF